MELEMLVGIQIPDSRYSRRNGAPQRFAPSQWQTTLVGPDEFVQRLLDELGTRSGIELVDHAFRVVMVTGEPDHWIRAVRRAHDRSALNSAVAYFLIWQFAASAVRGLSDADPVLSALSAQIERIEREYDLNELEAWSNHAGPPKWEALCEEWDATHYGLLRHILERNEEYELLRDFLRSEHPEGETLYKEGRTQIYGD